MNPVDFPEANALFHSPKDLPGSCRPIKGLVRTATSGIWDGSVQTIVAWKPTEEEIEQIVKGAPIFLSIMGCLPPHYLCTNINEALQ